ncbi:divergent polysaccharide deacetylase family protein [Roseobacter sp. CCS2]|uniref:divergent polysaccharide deacetylase family protein n=1 Tax=Roseobacter sp. CCS2 TaxID=391593 RepID=UPI0000F3C66C|nr:divergent polysaccharide deacetylase family protein [Roseobacter sp. CCS2]EBA11712.1 hypothetical protein RCCS2_17326 [Roseobacter sp. CCS2]
MKGVLQGSLWGVVLGVSGLSIASLMGEQPNFAQGPAAPQLSVPALDTVTPGPAVAFDASSDETPQFVPAAPLDDATDVAGSAPQVSTEPAALPQTADIAAAIEVPETQADVALGSRIDAPAVPRVETALMPPPAESEAPTVDTAPAEVQPTPPETSTATDEVAEAEQTTTEDLVAQDTDVVSAEDASAPDPTAVPEVVEEETAADIVAPVVDTAESNEAVVEVEPAPDAGESETVVAQDAVRPAGVPETTTDVAEENTSQQGTAIVADALPPTNTAVRINRPGTTEEEPQPEIAEPAAVDEIADDAPALLRYGVPFDPAEATALISVILIDDGQMADAPAAVAELGFVATVAVNALSSVSTDLAADYRAAGVEVAMQAELPPGAQPTDVEVAFEAARGLVPEVAMLFSDGTGAMQDRAVTAQVMEILASDGYGFVTVQRGLSNAARAADQAGVSAATIERDIDGAGEDQRMILRALDQAAFRARQTGTAVLLGRVTPETLAALRDWAADIDRETLEIAPVSAVLLRTQQG